MCSSVLLQTFCLCISVLKVLYKSRLQYSWNSLSSLLFVVLYAEGAEVIMACRDETKAGQVIDDIKKSLGSSSKVIFMKLDLSSLQSVRDFAAAFTASKFHQFFVSCLLIRDMDSR